MRWLVWVGLSLGAIVVLAGALLVSTSPGRDVLAGWIESFASKQIPGSVTIGKLESIGFLEPVASDVEFFTPQGELVLRVDRAEAQWNLQQLFQGTIALNKARVEGGEVVIEIDDNGRVNMKETFNKERENKPPLDLESMHFQNMEVLVRVSGETRFVVRDVQGFVSVWRRDTPGVRVSLGRIRGTFETPKIAGDKIELVDMEGDVWAQEDHVVSLVFHTRIGDGEMKAYLDYDKRAENAAKLRLRSESGAGARLAATADEVRSWFADKLDVTIEK